MKIHEFQAKDLFRSCGIPVPAGAIATTPAQAVDGAKSIPGPPWVVKAQVHAGGRGKGGGVRLVKTLKELEEAAQDILSHPLVTPQTGPSGQKVRRLLVEEGLAIHKEFYLGIVVDRKLECPAMLFSQAGGMEIEEVSAQHPELVLIENIDIAQGFMPYQARNFFYALDPLPDKGVLTELSAIMSKLY